MPDTEARVGDVPLSLIPAPHLGVSMSTVRMTWLVTLSLLPAAAWGVFLFGSPALILLAFSIGTAAAAELASTLPFGRFTLRDGSAVLTGLIVGLLMPPARRRGLRRRRRPSASWSSNRHSAASAGTG